MHRIKSSLLVVVVVALGAMIATAGVVATVSNNVQEGILLSPMHGAVTDNPLDPDKYLTEFNYGKVSTLPDGTTLREFTLIAEDVEIEVAPGIYFNAWAYNGTVPGPTLRATEGDRIRVVFYNQGSHPHTIHFHGKHQGMMDGVFEWVYPGGRFVYEFIAEPFGLHLYHCHVEPIEEHMNRGLYGVFIVDPKTPRPPATEMVMLLNGYDTDFDKENNFYTVNGIAFHYMKNPITVNVGESIRVYLVNILEFDQINNFHLHGDLFKLYRTGTSLTDYEVTDMVTMSQGERVILEFQYDYPGLYMFHAHKIEFADKGWTGLFHVVDETDTSLYRIPAQHTALSFNGESIMDKMIAYGANGYQLQLRAYENQLLGVNYDQEYNTLSVTLEAIDNSIHTQIIIPNTFDEFLSESYDARINGVLLNDRTFFIDRYSYEGKTSVHYIISSDEMQRLQLNDSDIVLTLQPR